MVEESNTGTGSLFLLQNTETYYDCFKMRLILYAVITVKIQVLVLRGLQYYDKRQSGTPGSFTFHIAVTKIKDSTTACGICVNHVFKEPDALYIQLIQFYLRKLYCCYARLQGWHYLGDE